MRIAGGQVSPTYICWPILESDTNATGKIGLTLLSNTMYVATKRTEVNKINALFYIVIQCELSILKIIFKNLLCNKSKSKA